MWLVVQFHQVFLVFWPKHIREFSVVGERERKDLWDIMFWYWLSFFLKFFPVSIAHIIHCCVFAVSFSVFFIRTSCIVDETEAFSLFAPLHTSNTSVDRNISEVYPILRSLDGCSKMLLKLLLNLLQFHSHFYVISFIRAFICEN